MADSGVVAENVMPNQKVYVLSKNSGWTMGTVTSVADDSTSLSGKKAVVAVDGGAEGPVTAQTVSSALHTIIDGCYDARDPDLFHVGDLHVAPLLYCLKERFEVLSQQYSKMGEMILSVNPFQIMAFNGKEEQQKYLTAPNTDLMPPHVWHIADKAYKEIVVRGLGNQSVVISGESGSGKTENTKALIGYLSAMSHRHSSNAVQKEIADRVSDRLRWSNPILESFGNARTVRNDNSSRFGKYTKLFFDPVSGVMVGGEMVTYLLEKSRIITQGEGERNYHIFYEMVCGLPQDKKQQFKLKGPREWKTLNGGGTMHRRGADGKDVNDALEFKEVVEAMTQMNITPEVQDSIWRCLSAILHLSEVDFVADANDKASFKNTDSLNFACQLLGVDPKLLAPCFLEKSKTKIMTTLSSVSEAAVLRDAFSKGLYIGLFDFLVKRINEAVAPQGESANTKDRYIGVLDIFGFENFKTNSFEQLCINFANEGLASHYNKFTFKNDEAECKAEGIACPPIVFPDNEATLDMLEHDKTGVFPLLDEACNFKNGTSEAFTEQSWANWKTHKGFILPKATRPDTFGVHHYANDVMYTTTGWLEKNGDALKMEARECIRKSTDPSGTIATLFETLAVQASDGMKQKKITVAVAFRKQLSELRGELEATTSHFVRCIKPNMQAVPRKIENEHVGAQLESAGVIQTISLKRQGYPVRRPHKDFATFFFPILSKKHLPLWRAKDYVAVSKNLLDFYCKLYTWKAPHFAVGINKVFLKAFVWSKLEKLLIRKNRYRLKRCVPYLCNWIRAFREKKAAEKRRIEEEQRALQEAAAKRAAMPKEQTIKVAKDSGLPPEKAQWFEEVSLIFVTFDLPILLDVCYNLKDKNQVLKALTEMQKQRIDDTLPVTLKRLFQSIGLRDAVAENLVAKGIVSVKKLSELSNVQLDEMGLNEKEKQGVAREMVRQQNEVMVHERLANSIGTAAFDQMLISVKDQNAKAMGTKSGGGGGSGSDSGGATSGGNDGVKVSRLMEMGMGTKEDCIKALQQANGDVQIASGILLGEAPPPQATRAPSGGGGGGSGSGSGSTGYGAVGGYPAGGSGGGGTGYGATSGYPAGPGARPPPPQTRPQPAQAVPPRAPPPPAGQSGGGYQQPPHGHGQPPGRSQVSRQHITQLTSMGFEESKAVDALVANNGDLDRAITQLLSGV